MSERDDLLKALKEVKNKYWALCTSGPCKDCVLDKPDCCSGFGIHLVRMISLLEPDPEE